LWAVSAQVASPVFFTCYNIAQVFFSAKFSLLFQEFIKLQNEDSITTHSHISTDVGRSLASSKIVLPLYESRRWIRLFAACLIFYGALITVTGAGVLVAWVPMWIGILLLLVSRTIKTAYEKNDEHALMLSLTRLKTIFTILGLSSVALIISSIYLVKYAFDKSLF